MAALNGTVDSDTVETRSDELGGITTGARHERRLISFTSHARGRGARRNLAPDAVDYVLAYGRMIQRTGMTFFFLGGRDMPPADRRASWASRLEGTIILVAPDGAVITVYRNRCGLRAILRKMKYRIPELSRRPNHPDIMPVDVTEEASA